jgi:hypothetical protein
VRTVIRDRTLLALVVTLLGVLVGWPLLAPIVAACDDVGFLKAQYAPHTWLDALGLEWRAPLFRPLAALSAQLIDPTTRTSPWVTLLQSAVLLAGLPAVVRLCGRLTSHAASARWACALWLMHPATAVSLWQLDTLSQSASATAGLWLVALACGAWVPRRPMLAWLIITVLGLLTKETFLGWLAAAALLRWSTRASATDTWRPLLAALGLGAAFVLARVMVIGPSLMATGDEKYALHLSGAVVRNLGVLMAGGLAFGPLHALRVLGASDMAWWLGMLGPAVHVVIVLMALSSPGAARSQVGLLWCCALCALAPVMLLGHVSELYLMGPNALICIALAAAVSQAHGRAWARVLRSGAWLVLIGIGAVGVASRAHHFGLTWEYSRLLSEQTRALPPVQQAPSSCQLEAASHSVYYVTPLAALNVAATTDIAAAAGRPLPHGWADRLRCEKLPSRRAF